MGLLRLYCNPLSVKIMIQDLVVYFALDGLIAMYVVHKVKGQWS